MLLILALGVDARGDDTRGNNATVHFATLHPDGVQLAAVLARPDGNGPFPAVVLMHGCDGLFTKSGRLASRERTWMERLRGDSYVVLAVDSFNPRGFRSTCTDGGKVSAEDDRPYDAYAALGWLRRQPFVGSAPVAVMGWSHGGTATLATVSQAALKRVGWQGPGFAAAVAMYPGCLVLSRTDYVAAAPILMQLGAKDDWTPARFCLRLATAARKRGSTIALDEYANAYHGFDQPNGHVHTTHASGGRTVHVGAEPKARAQAIDRVQAYLAETLKH